MNVSMVNEAPADDAEVIRRVLAGNRDEFRHLVLAYQEQVFAIIMRQVGDRQLASELAQETFLKAYVHLKQFKHQARFSTWLVRIALNTTNSYFSSKAFKTRMRSITFEPQQHEHVPLSAREDDPINEETLGELRNAIGLLAPMYREVLTLCALNNHSYEDAAQLLGVPIGTVRSRLNKARLLLKEKFMEVTKS